MTFISFNYYNNDGVIYTLEPDFKIIPLMRASFLRLFPNVPNIVQCNKFFPNNETNAFAQQFFTVN